MASYTGMSNLRNHPHRSGFDIGRKNAFTAKVGELLPVYWDISMPGDKYKFNVEYFTRTQPVETSAYTRLREYFDFYAVPLRLLWKSAPSVLTQMQDINQIQALSLTQNLSLGTYLPSLGLSQFSTFLYRLNGSSSPSAKPSFVNAFGFSRADLAYKLFSYLGYGNFIKDKPTSGNRWWSTSLKVSTPAVYTQNYIQNNVVNIFPLLAYQKIYQDFFRWSQWEDSNPSSYNVDYFSGLSPYLITESSIPADSSDYWKSDTMFDLKYCNWNKDMLMGVLPNSQFGDVAVLDVEGPSIPDVVLGKGSKVSPVGVASAVSSNSAAIPFFALQASGTNTLPVGSTLRVDLSALQSQFSVLALRQAEALQKWKEITQSVDTNYRDQIKAHFGINTPANMSHMAQYIGGIARNLDISEVVNNNLYEDGSEAVIYGKGVGSGTGKMRYRTGSQYCIIMCIYHALPLLDYAISGQDPQLLCTSVEDLPIPEFDNIGMEAVPATTLFNSNRFDGTLLNDFLGYNPRYWPWKSKIDRVHGAFTTTLKDWVAPIDDNYLFKWFNSKDGKAASVSWPFFKVNPNTLDSIFAVAADSIWESDQFLINCDVSCKAVRPLSQDGMPY